MTRFTDADAEVLEGRLNDMTDIQHQWLLAYLHDLCKVNHKPDERRRGVSELVYRIYPPSLRQPIEEDSSGC